MEGTMEYIKKYLRSHHGVIRASFAYVIWKTITVQTYGDYPTYITPDDEIARMLHLPLDKNRLFSEKDARTAQAHTADCKIDNQMVYDVLDQICKDTDQRMSKRDSRGAYDAIHSRWLSPNHVNMTASEAEMALQMSTYDVEKKA